MGKISVSSKQIRGEKKCMKHKSGAEDGDVGQIEKIAGVGSERRKKKEEKRDEMCSDGKRKSEKSEKAGGEGSGEKKRNIMKCGIDNCELECKPDDIGLELGSLSKEGLFELSTGRNGESERSKNVEGETEGKMQKDGGDYIGEMEMKMKKKKDRKKERENERYNGDEGGQVKLFKTTGGGKITDLDNIGSLKEEVGTRKRQKILAGKVGHEVIGEVKKFKDLNVGKETAIDGNDSGLRPMMKESEEHKKDGGTIKGKIVSREEKNGENGGTKVNEGDYMQKKKNQKLRSDEVADVNKSCNFGNEISETGRIGISIKMKVGEIKNQNVNDVVEREQLSKKGKSSILGKAGFAEHLAGEFIKKKSENGETGDSGSNEGKRGLRSKKKDNRESKGVKGMDISKKSKTDCEVANRDSVNNGSTDRKEKAGNDGHSNSKQHKRVSFSGEVQVFPTSDEKDGKMQLIQGKRFTKEEDAMIKEAVLEYIKVHELGPNGLEMLLNCKRHRELRGCWKEIGAALPWRPKNSVSHRAHILFERSETRKWKPEEYDLIRSFHEEHGSDWKKLSSLLGKYRHHLKDTWRRIRLPNVKKGHWSQEEYQTLFDLVNTDMQMKAFEEKKTKHGMLRDNIAWEAISDKLATRTSVHCCKKWYDQLASSMVVEGIWDNVDDYWLISALLKLDACCPEEVNWDDLLEHRPGEICRRRWNQMTKHIGDYQGRPFPEQVELLSSRYCSIVPDN